MARAYKCDRCGEFYEPQKLEKGDFDIAEIIAEDCGYYKHDKKDLCPVCQKKFAEWWNLER